MSDQLEHQHDWRIAPHKHYRPGPDGGKQYMLRCPTCTVTGWGVEHSDVAEWPKWVGLVAEVQITTS